MYGYAKRLEFKNQMKKGGMIEHDLRSRVYRLSLSSRESVLVMDMVRKHKAMRRDLKKMRRMVRKSPIAASHAVQFKAKPFGHCEPTTAKLVDSLVEQIQTVRKQEEEVDLAHIKGSTQLLTIPSDERESVGSLEGLELREGVARPPRPSHTIPPFKLPLSRPRTQAFHQIRPKTMNILDVHFSEWFIGMTEAQSPFKYTSDQRPYFALEHTDLKMFRRIRSKIHFGHVDDIKNIWYVIDDENLPRIIHLLNGNLHLQDSRENFQKWVEKYQHITSWGGDDFQVDMSCGWRPQLNNKWLMGFIDSSRDMFAGRLVESSSYPYFRINLKFWVIHHDINFLQHLQTIFAGGDIEQDGESFRWSIKERKHHRKLNMYCRMFRPMSLKNVNAVRYDRLVHYPFIKVKTSTAWVKLRKLISQLNKSERSLSLSLSFHPYHERYKESVRGEMSLGRTGASIEEIKRYAAREREKHFSLWETPKYLSLIEEVD